MKKLESRESRAPPLGLIVGGKAPVGVLAPRIVVQASGCKVDENLHSQSLWKDTESVGNWLVLRRRPEGQGTGVGERFNIPLNTFCLLNLAWCIYVI